MQEGYFDPARRALAKQRMRERDDRRLAQGAVSQVELQRRNSMFADLDLSASVVIIRSDRR